MRGKQAVINSVGPSDGTQVLNTTVSTAPSDRKWRIPGADRSKVHMKEGREGGLSCR
jgi:hypothetical protein